MENSCTNKNTKANTQYILHKAKKKFKNKSTREIYDLKYKFHTHKFLILMLY